MRVIHTHDQLPVSALHHGVTKHIQMIKIPGYKIDPTVQTEARAENTAALINEIHLRPEEVIHRNTIIISGAIIELAVECQAGRGIQIREGCP